MPKEVREKTEKGASRFITMEHQKSKGQHFLVNPLIVNAIVDKADIKNTDTGKKFRDFCTSRDEMLIIS